jgi:hypothetical protein
MKLTLPPQAEWSRTKQAVCAGLKTSIEVPWELPSVILLEYLSN